MSPAPEGGIVKQEGMGREDCEGFSLNKLWEKNKKPYSEENTKDMVGNHLMKGSGRDSGFC